MVVTQEELKYMGLLESSLEEGLINSNSGYLCRKGNKPIIFSVSHSVSQLREGVVKQGEYRTAVLCEWLYRLMGSSIIYKTINRNDDANYDEYSYYKEVLKELVLDEGVGCLVDLHIMSPVRDYNIDIGTGKGRNLVGNERVLEGLYSNLLGSGIEGVKTDYKFPAMGAHRVVSYIARECCIPSIQLEINWNLLDVELDGGKGLVRLLGALEGFVEGLG